MKNISDSDLEIIGNAKRILESESVAMRISQIAAKPLEGLIGILPPEASKGIGKMVNASLELAAQSAMATTGSQQRPILRDDWIHKIAVDLAGLAGGFGGIATTAAELPFSTMLMLRSIGCVAEAEGNNINDRKVRLSCISVLAMGASPEKIQNDELGYWVVRKAVAGFVTQAAEWSGRGATPALAKFIIEVGKRFGIAMSAKAAVQLAPIAGAISGATINHVFLDHYQKVAHSHFALERLNLIYGETVVREAYSAA